MKEERRISCLCSFLICCQMRSKRTDYCKVRIEVLNLFLGEKYCVELVKPLSITSVIPNVMRWLLAFSMGNTTDTNNGFFCKVKHDLVIETIWGRFIVICFITCLIPATSPVISEADPEQIPTKAFSSKICQNWWVIEHIKSPQKSEHGNMLKFSKTLRSPLHTTWKRGWNRKCSFTSLVLL